MAGRYIVIEGHDGTGKSTQVEVIRQKLDEVGIKSIEFHEPAGTPIADEIRTILKNGNLKRDALTDALLFSAARHEIWTNEALPALKLGQWVVASRNYYSTLAYQGYGEGLNKKIIDNLTKTATDNRYMSPDLAIILSLDDERARNSRIKARGEVKNPDNFESKNQTFQDTVRQSYLRIAHDKNLPVIDASESIESITQQIWLHIKTLL